METPGFPRGSGTRKFPYINQNVTGFIQLIMNIGTMAFILKRQVMSLVS
jgi:hypothetical protein